MVAVASGTRPNRRNGSARVSSPSNRNPVDAVFRCRRRPQTPQTRRAPVAHGHASARAAGGGLDRMGPVIVSDKVFTTEFGKDMDGRAMQRTPLKDDFGMPTVERDA